MSSSGEGVSATAKSKDASDLIFQEIERVVDAQLDNFKNLTSRAGTILSVLIGAITATLTIAGVVAHPPLWALALTSAPLLLGVITSCAVFLGSEVTTGPDPDSIIPFARESEEDVRAALMGFYNDVVQGSTDDRGKRIPGNRELLKRKVHLFEASVVLLAITVVTLVAVALILYSGWP